jgi:hypothetical protein
VSKLRNGRLSQKQYPYESGDVTVIGPEAFIDHGRGVISYRGENFYAARVDPAPLAAWERELLDREPDSFVRTDPELAALSSTVDRLEKLDGQTIGRIVRYLASRYGGAS